MKKLLTSAFVLLASTACAEFSATEDRLFTEWPELHRDSQMITTEFQVHAIVDAHTANKVMYVISGNFKGRVEVFGAAECGVEFTILDSFTNDMRDIRCVTEDGMFNRKTYILKMGDQGLYVRELAE